MNPSNSAGQLKEIIEKAIEDHKITRDEYEMIIYQATADGIIDSEERALLQQLQDLIENKSVKLVP